MTTAESTKPKQSPANGAEADDFDPADAFARAKPADEVIDPPISDKKSGKGSKKKAGARQPVVDLGAKPADDDEGMDPFDAATEIVGMLDGMMAMAIMFRQYDKIVLPDGTLMVTVVQADEKAKERMRKALARLLKSAGANMSPGAAVALAAFGCYGAPVLALEYARASAKKA